MDLTSPSKEERKMEIIIYRPENAEKQALFDALLAKSHAEYILEYIDNLPCSRKQKLKLLDAIVQTILTWQNT